MTGTEIICSELTFITNVGLEPQQHIDKLQSAATNSQRNERADQTVFSAITSRLLW